MQEVNKFISIGERINLMLLNDYDNHQYVSRVEELNVDGTIDVLIPISKNRIIYIKNDTVLKVVVAKEGAIYEFQAKIVSKLFGAIPLLRLMRVSEVNKIQRRNYYRLKAIKTMKARKIVNLKEKLFDEFFTATIVDISGGGLAISTSMELETNDLLEINVDLNSNLNILGKVLRKEIKEEIKPNKYAYGIAFEKITEIERNIIMRFIFEEQRKLAKKGLI
ncbi:MAG: hypothetical protein A2Y23_03640 [Clostridiales bacterium GWB2_37_7]|nr:MAG: hypothetical protein A2Y23_03640 [Clostridiales bacterium GWB2_37_7]